MIAVHGDIHRWKIGKCIYIIAVFFLISNTSTHIQAILTPTCFINASKKCPQNYVAFTNNEFWLNYKYKIGASSKINISTGSYRQIWTVLFLWLTHQLYQLYTKRYGIFGWILKVPQILSWTCLQKLHNFCIANIDWVSCDY